MGIILLRATAIVLNAIFLFSSLGIIAYYGMPSLYPLFVIIPLLSPVLSIILLAMPRVFLSGFMRMISIFWVVLANLVLISTVIYCFVSWGMPGIAFQYLLIPIWFVMPVITCVAIFLVKGRCKGNLPVDSEFDDGIMEPI